MVDIDELLNNFKCGIKFEESFQQLVQISEKGDKRESILASTSLASYYQNGRRKELDKAFAFWLKAARAGHAEAQFQVGEYYRMGWGNVEKNEDEAIQYYEWAANQGHSKAKDELLALEGQQMS